MPSDLRTPGLLSLLPEGTEADLRKVALIDTEAPVVWRERQATDFAFAMADHVLRDRGHLGTVERERIAYLLLLLIEQAKRCEALEAGLRPFAEAFAAKVDRPPEERRAWNAKMPGHWPIEIDVTMADGRAARTLLESEPR